MPAGVKPISCKWVYKVKRRSDGSVERARLVARAFSQQYGIDYDETFSPVAKITTVRVLISLTTSQSWADGRKKCLSLWRLSTPFSGAPTKTITSRIAKSVYVPPEPSPRFQQTVLHILPIDIRTNQPAQRPPPTWK